MSTSSDDKDIIAISKVFQGGKTVVPSDVRKLINVREGDKIVWRYEKNRGIIYIRIEGESLVRYTVRE